MTKTTIRIGNKEMEMATSAYTPILYSELFGANIFSEMNEIIRIAGETGTVPYDKVTTLYRLAYCMAKHADPDIPEMREWLDQFDVYDIPEIAGKMVDLWAAENEQQSTP